MYFGPTSKQILLRPNLGNLQATKQYSLWGWFRFQGETPSISNILGWRTIIPYDPNTSLTRPFPDPEFPDCPYTLVQIAEDPTLLNDPAAGNTPNCYANRNDFVAAMGGGTLYRPGPDVLFVNYDLTSLNDYSVIFLIQINTSESGNSDMRILGFTRIPLVKNVWSFFAISCDYVNGVATAYFRAYDSITNPYKDSIAINYPQFLLTQNTQLVLAGVETNPYFESTSGFIGDIALIEIALYYTPSLELIWAGFMPFSAYAGNGVIADLFFEQYTPGSPIVSRALGGNSYLIVGPSEPLFSSDNNSVGVRVPGSSYLVLPDINFNNNDSLTRTLSFLFTMSYNEPLSDPLYLLRRGNPDQNGYFAISMVKNSNGGRNVRVDATGSESRITWTSNKSLPPGVKYTFDTGLALNANNSAYILYWDESGYTEVAKVSDSFPYDNSGTAFVILGNQNDTSLTGSVDLYRFTALNSLSNIIYFNYLSETTDPAILELNRFCVFRTDNYGNSFGCEICRDSVLQLDTRRCVDFCPFGFKNAGSAACIPCAEEGCTEIESTTWQIYKISENYYELRPSRPIMSDVDCTNLFNVTIPDVNTTDYTYEFVQNPDNQTCGLYFNFTKEVRNQTITIYFTQEEESPAYDMNRNIVYSSYTSYEERRVCYVREGKAQSLRGLAISALVFMLVAIIATILLTLLYWILYPKLRVYDLGAAWKWLLYYWMRLQMITFFLFLGIYMPCCVQVFLGQLFYIDASWDLALGRRINSINMNNPKYRSGVVPNPAPQQFADYGVFPYILHNLGVWFIVQCFIFLCYIVLKLWDLCAIPSSPRCCYFLLNIWEWTIMIVGYLVIAMQAFTYAGLNIRKSQWQYSYFTVCFIIAIFYIAVFALFYIYAAIRLLGPPSYFFNPIKYNKFIFFFTGYRHTYWARSFDLWYWLQQLVIGLMLGLVYDSGLAQTIVILCMLVAFWFLTMLIQPYKSLLIFISELIIQLLVIVAMILFLVIACYNEAGCYDCPSWTFETNVCWAIVMLLWIALLINFLAFMAYLAMSLCPPIKPVREIVQENLVVGPPQVYGQRVINTSVPYEIVQENIVTEEAFRQEMVDKDDIVIEKQVVFEQRPPGMMPGPMPGMMPGPMPGVMPGMMPGAMPEPVMFEERSVSNYGGNKSMKEFLGEMQQGLAPDTSMPHNVTYMSDQPGGFAQPMDGVNRAGVMAGDAPDEEVMQNSILRALSADGDGESQMGGRGTTNFLVKKKEMFYNTGGQDGGASAMAPSEGTYMRSVQEVSSVGGGGFERPSDQYEYKTSIKESYNPAPYGTTETVTINKYGYEGQASLPSSIQQGYDNLPMYSPVTNINTVYSKTGSLQPQVQATTYSTATYQPINPQVTTTTTSYQPAQATTTYTTAAYQPVAPQMATTTTSYQTGPIQTIQGYSTATGTGLNFNNVVSGTGQVIQGMTQINETARGLGLANQGLATFSNTAGTYLQGAQQVTQTAQQFTNLAGLANNANGMAADVTSAISGMNADALSAMSNQTGALGKMTGMFR